MTTGYISQFLGTLPVGAVIQSPANLSDPSWVRMDNSVITRTTYPAFSAMWGSVGAFTPTVRSLNALPTTNAIATNGTTVVAAGTAGTNGVQVSSNAGVTWSSATMAASISISCLAWNGTVYIGVPSGSQAPQYSTVGTGTWTAATGSISGATGIATNPSNGTALVVSTSGTPYISTNASAPSFSLVTSLAPGSFGGALSGTPIVYSGTQFMLFSYQGIGQGYQTSTTGATGTWTANPNPVWGMAPVSGVASDGAGNVLVVIGGSSLAYKSNDGGATFKQTLLPGNAVPYTVANSPVSYTNGRFFVSLLGQNSTTVYADGSMAVSSDLNTWFFIPCISVAAFSGSTQGTQVVYQGGNYIFISVQSTVSQTCVTATEDTTKMYLPNSRRAFYTTNGGLNSVANNQEWIKVQ